MASAESSADDAFYESCDVEVEAEIESAVVEADFGCLLLPNDDAQRYDLIVDVSNLPSAGRSLVADAHKLAFEQLLRKPWARDKRLLVLDDGLSVVESARRCRRLSQAGLGQARVLVGGVRAYVDTYTAQRVAGLSMIAPSEIAAAMQRGRVHLLLLDEYRGPEGFDVGRVVERIDGLAPRGAPEQFMPVLMVGSERDYWAVAGAADLRWWVYYLRGGEAAFAEALNRHRAIADARHVRLRKCDAY